MTKEKEAFLNNIVTLESLRRNISIRKRPYILKSVSHDQQEEYLKLGWEIDKKLKNKVRLKKPKSPERTFEDEVWMMFASLGFEKLNKPNSLIIPCGNPPYVKVNTIAFDKESIMVVNVETSVTPRKSNLKDKIEALGSRKNEIIKFLRKLSPDIQYKIKFILVTKNYYLSDADNEKLQSYQFVHFEEEAIQYYQDLSRHLGLSARFQLQGNLFSGQKIPELDNRVSAIRGKMGGHTYYSFSIEPEKLLKIGYVLHRNKANKKLMPTYQRIIKKSRLKNVQEFVENGGFFPNSIVISVDTTRKLKFELSKNQVDNSISRIGILHLPQQYRSAYIIDGQHRLYGYGNSEYKSKNSIPVVAFVNLEREKQVELFMQINENQKAVPKNLRNTLNADLLWSSENLNDQIRAVKLQIAQDLGEDVDSPLFEKIIIGENVKSNNRCVTIDTIKTALDRTNFFGTNSKDELKERGTFHIGNNEKTYKNVLKYLKGCLQFFKDGNSNEWEKGEGENNEGFLSINAGVYALILIFSDIMDLLIEKGKVVPGKGKVDTIISEAKYYLTPLINHFNTISNQERDEFRRSYGIAGRTKYWRKLQIIIRKSRAGFNPKGLDEELQKEEKQFNSEAFSIISDIEISFRRDFREKLEDHHGGLWFKRGVPESVYESAIALAAKKNRDISNPEEEKTPWDCLHIIDYRKIALYSSNWRDLFEKAYTKPGEEKIGNKEEKTKWMVRLEQIRNKVAHNEGITKSESEFINELNEWLINGSINNNLK